MKITPFSTEQIYAEYEFTTPYQLCNSDCETVTVMAFATRLAEEAGVLIHPAVTLGSDDRHMRMGFGRSVFGLASEKFEAYMENTTLSTTFGV